MAGFTEEDYSIGPAGLLAGVFNPQQRDLRSSIGGEMRAQDILSKAGSVMARPEKPEWRKQSPLADTLLTMVDKALSFDPWHQILNVDPKMQMTPMEAIANVGGAENAIWGPIRTRGQKQAVRSLWRDDPEKVMAVQADPRQLDLMADRSPNVVRNAKAIENLGLVPSGANAVYNPAEELIKVAPSSLLGGHYEKPMEVTALQRQALDKLSGLGLPWVDEIAKQTRGGFVTKPGGTVNLPETMTHEAEHFLNQPRIYKGPLTHENAADSLKVFEQLSPYLDDHSIRAAAEAAMKYQDPRIAVDEALAYLTGKGTRFPAREVAGSHLQQILKTRTGPQGNLALQITPATVQAAIDLAEGMAHPQLAPKAAEIWDQLAAKGQIGSRTGTYNPQTPFKDLASMRQRTEPTAMYDRLPRASRSFVSAEDLARTKAGETLPALGSAMPDIPRPVSSPGALDAFEALRKKLGLPEADLGGMAPEFYGKKTTPELESRFRDTGMKRMSWTVNPSQYRAEVEALPGYQRFIDLLRNTQIAPKLGKEFETYRGMEATDPFMQAILGKGERPSATAVTPDPYIAKQFGVGRAEEAPSYVVGGRTTPEGVVGMVPRRGGSGVPTELIVDPNKMKDINILAEYPGTSKVFEELQGMKRTAAPAFPEVNRENLAAHLGVPESELERLYNAIPFGSDVLYGPETRGLGPAIMDKYVNNPLEKLLEKMGLGSNVGFDFLPPLKGELESKRGGKALQDLYENWNQAASDPVGRRQRVNMAGEFIGPPMTGKGISKDAFMTEVMNQLAQASNRWSPGVEGMSQGVTGFRRQIAPVENMLQHPITPLSKGKTLDILGHLDEQGLLKPENLANALGGPGQIPYVNPEGLERIQRMLERVQYDPVTGGTKGKAAGELESLRGGKALNDLFENWATQDAVMQPSRGKISPQDRFMDQVLAALATATHRKRPHFESGAASGISGFRRALAPVENQYNMAVKPLNPQQSLDILEQLKEYGFMEPGSLKKAMAKDPKAVFAPNVNEEGMAFIRRLMERLGR